MTSPSISPARRVSAGVPSGGQFAASTRGESGITLAPATQTVERPAAARFHPGVTNCGGTLSHTGCDCPTTVTGEMYDPTLTGAVHTSIDDLDGTDDADVAYAARVSDMDDRAFADEVASALCFQRTDTNAQRYDTLLAEARLRRDATLPSLPGADTKVAALDRLAIRLLMHDGRHGSPTSTGEARAAWSAVVRTHDDPMRGPLTDYDALTDEAMIDFARHDEECAAHAIDALTRTYGQMRARPSADADALQTRLATSPEPYIRALLAANTLGATPLTPALAADPDPMVRTAIAGRWSLVNDGFTGSEFHLSPDKPGWRDLAHIGRDLARDPDTGVRRTLAMSSLLPDEKTGEILAEDRDPMVRRALVTSDGARDLSDKAWKRLSRDPEPGIRRSAAESPWLPEKIRRKMHRDPDPDVAAAAQR